MRLSHAAVLRILRKLSLLDFFTNSEQRQAAEEQARELAAEVADLKWVMSDQRGRRFVWRQLAVAGIYRPSYTGDDRTIFNEGQRNVGLHLLSAITEHCPDEYLQMLKEHQQ